MKRILALLFSAACSLAACSLVACSTVSMSPQKILTGPLYPPGVYEHTVKFELSNSQQQFTMRGVVSLHANPQKISLVGLSPFNTTVFRISQVAESEPQVEVFDESLQEHSSDILKNFLIMKQTLLQKREALAKVIRDSDKNDVSITVSDYDQKDIPRKVILSSTKYKIVIEVAGYELEDISTSGTL